MSLTFDLQWTRQDFTLQAQASWPLEGVTALFGPSGCGKTSLLRCLAGLEPAVRGHIRLGAETWLDPTGRRQAVHRRQLGLVFQHAALFAHLDVRGNLQYAQRRTPRARRRLGIVEVAERCGLSHLLDRATHGLSGGERQRLALARALITSPRLLMLDEPLASLDGPSKAELLPYLIDLHRTWQIPVLYVTHDLDELATIADRVVCLAGGRITRETDVATLLAHPSTARDTAQAAQVIIDATVVDHDPVDHLLTLSFPGGRLHVVTGQRPDAQKLRVVIHAHDVSLVVGPLATTSFLNVLPARVRAIEDLGGGRALIGLHCGTSQLLASITTRSLRSLDLRPGQTVHAQVKSLALIAALPA